MTIYISGQITDNPNFKADFENAEEELINQGHLPVNPTKLPHNHDKTYNSYMKEDIKAMLDCDAVYMLHNHGKSQGAMIELNLAIILGISVYHAGSAIPIQELNSDEI